MFLEAAYGVFPLSQKKMPLVAEIPRKILFAGERLKGHVVNSLLLMFGVIGVLINYLVVRTTHADRSIRLLIYLSMVDILSSFNNVLRFIIN